MDFFFTVSNAVFYVGDLVIRAIFDFDLNNLAPARLDQLISGSPAANDTRSVLKIVSFLFSTVFAMILGFAIMRKGALSKPAPAPAQPIPTAEPIAALPEPGAWHGRWQEVMSHLDSPRENDWKQAVMEADKLVDSALQQSGFPGDTFGDRLMNIQPGTLVSLDGLWWAHRIRNRVAHEVDYFLRYTEARQAVSYFQHTLEELKLV